MFMTTINSKIFNVFIKPLILFYGNCKKRRTKRRI